MAQEDWRTIVLKSLHLENFTVFPDVELNFGKNLNVIIGENGAGKTHILKAAYSAAFLRSYFMDPPFNYSQATPPKATTKCAC